MPGSWPSTSGTPSARAVKAFAAEIARPRGSVAGRLHHDGHLPFNSLREARVPIREHLAAKRWTGASAFGAVP